jgi:hypothetical protein
MIGKRFILKTRMDKDLINEIMFEAAELGLEYEIEELATHLISSGYNHTQAYIIAYNEWIK